MKMDKQQLAIVIVLASVVVFITAYTLYTFGDSGEVEASFTHEETNKPYQSMFDLIEKEEQETKRGYNSINSGHLSESEFDKFLISEEVHKDRIIDSLQHIIDSLLVKNARPSRPPKKNYRTTVKEPEIKKEIPVEEERTFSSATIEDNEDPVMNNALIKAVVHGEQKVRSNEYIKLRTTEACYVQGIKVPANFFFTGKASFSNDRIFVTVSSFKYGDRLIDAVFEIFDSGDGIRGIHVEGGLEQQIAEESIRNAAGGVRVNVPFVGGISTNAIRRKAEDISVIIPSEYKVLLKSES